MRLVEKINAVARQWRRKDQEQVKLRVKHACERCGKETWALNASLFEVAMICPDCRDQESKSPHYLEACALYVEGESGDVVEPFRM